MAPAKARSCLKIAAWAIAAIAIMLVGGYWATPGDPAPLAPSDFDRRISPQALAQDVDLLVDTIDAVHINPYHHTTREAFRQDIENLKTGITEPLTRREFFRRLAPVVASLRDGHTNVKILTDEIRHYIGNGGLLFPLAVRFSPVGTFVSEDHSPEPVIEPGTELMSIDGIPLEQLVQELVRFVSSERAAHRAASIESLFPLWLWLVYEREGPFTVVIRPPDATEAVSREIDGITYAALEAGERRGADPGPHRWSSYTTLPDLDAGILEVRLFTDLDAFATFLEETFALIQRDGVTSLILDLRRNGGGSTRVSDELLRRLTEAPVRNYARYELKVSPQVRTALKQDIPRAVRWLPLQYLVPLGRKVWFASDGSTVVIEGTELEPAHPSRRFDGDLYLLTGPQTFSTAVTVSSVVKDFGLGTLVGEETGGLACAYGDTFLCRLPHSQLEVGIAYKFYIRPSGEETEGGIRPDHTVLSPGHAIGTDPVLAYVEALIRAAP